MTATKFVKFAPKPPFLALFGPKSQDYRPKSQDYRPKSPNNGPKSGDYGSLFGDYGSKSPDYGSKSPNNGSKSGDYGSKSPNYESKSPDYSPLSGDYESKSPDSPKPAPHSGVDEQTRQGVAQNKRFQDEQSREGFIPSGAPGSKSQDRKLPSSDVYIDKGGIYVCGLHYK